MYPAMLGFLHLTAPYANRNGKGVTNERLVDKLVEELGQMIARNDAVKSFGAELQEFMIASSG